MEKKLHEDEVGASIKHAEMVSSEEESQLRIEWVLGVHSPSALVWAEE